MATGADPGPDTSATQTPADASAPSDLATVTDLMSWAQVDPAQLVTGVHWSLGTVAPYRAPSRAALDSEILCANAAPPEKTSRSTDRSNGTTSANSTSTAPRSAARRPLREPRIGC